MKIALVILHADPARGGAERYTADLAHALVARGHDISLLASSFESVPRGEGRGEGSAGGLRTEDLGLRPPAITQVLLKSDAPTRLGRYVRFLDALDAHLATMSYDVVHAMLPVRRCDVYHPHAGLAAESIVSGHLKHRTPAARWFAQHATRFNRKRRRFAAVEQELLTGSNAPVVLCLSDYVKATLRKHYALPDRKLATLFNGTDLAKFDPASRPDARLALRGKLNIPPDQTVALIIAQDFERKGLHEAVLALEENPRVSLLVVGKQSAAAYEALADRHGVRPQLIVAGPTTDPYAFYQAADCFVLPTRHDPCSLVVLEALAMGVPVISTIFNGACEIMTDGVHGYVLPDPSDVNALADRLRRMTDPETRRRMSEACLALRPQLSQEHHVDELLRIYAALLRSKGILHPT